MINIVFISECIDRRYFSIHSTQTMLSTNTTTVIHKSRPILSRRSLESGLRHSSARIADWPRGHSKSIQSTQRNAYVMRCETAVRQLWLDTRTRSTTFIKRCTPINAWHASVRITSLNFSPFVVRASTDKFLLKNYFTGRSNKNGKQRHNVKPSRATSAHDSTSYHVV